MNDTKHPFQTVKTNEYGAPEISPQELMEKRGEVEMIDVRRPDEYTGELAHIDGTRLVTLETDFESELPKMDSSKTYVFICRSGGRSSSATLMAREKGITSFNMEGGMLRWNALDLPTVK